MKIVYEGGGKIQNIHTNSILPSDNEEVYSEERKF